MEIMDVAVSDVVVESSEMERAAVRHSEAGHLTSLYTGKELYQSFKSFKVTPEFCQDTQLKYVLLKTNLS